MQDKDRVALAQIVIAHREHVIALEPLGKGMLGTTLRYDYEVRDEKEYFKGVPSPRVPKDMINLDRYENALKKLVKRKAAGKKIEVTEPEEEKGNVIDLMEAL